LVELPASFALTTAADHHLFTDGASYEIPNFPVLKLARWLTAQSKGGHFNPNVRGPGGGDADDAPARMKIFFLKNRALGRTRFAPPGPIDVRH
jgi:hypothetical protein